MLSLITLYNKIYIPSTDSCTEDWSLHQVVTASKSSGFCISTLQLFRLLSSSSLDRRPPVQCLRIALRLPPESSKIFQQAKPSPFLLRSLVKIRSERGTLSKDSTRRLRNSSGTIKIIQPPPAKYFLRFPFLVLFILLSLNIHQMLEPTPDGHRAPVAELFKSNRRSVNTQTPIQAYSTNSSSGLFENAIHHILELSI